MKKLLGAFFVVLIGLVQPVFSENVQTLGDEPPAPVEDLSSTAPSTIIQTAPTSRPVQQEGGAQNQQLLAQNPPLMTSQQRVRRLEQQMKNFTQMDLPSKIDMLQKQLQVLRGELDMQTHQIKQLNVQQKKFYDAIDRRLAALGTKTAPAENNPPTPSEKALPESSSGLDAVTRAKNNAEMNLYLTALKSLAQKNYQHAVKMLKQYLKAYPEGRYRAKAYYWLGQAYYVQGQLKEASWQFRTVIDKFPKSPRAPDAVLKLALIHDAQGQPVLARKALSHVMRHYPSSRAATLARQKMTSPRKSAK